MTKRFTFFLFLLLPFWVYAQKQLNDNYRLPLTANMPEWAKDLYLRDEVLNVFELDKKYKPWSITYDSLKAAVAKAGDNADRALIEQTEHYKRYVKYYTRWRARVYPYLQNDGSLDFSLQIEEARPSKTSNLRASNWSYLGPVVTRWRQNDNAAQPLAPYQANVYSFDIAPSNPNILYCGTETGVVNKTTDKGLNWSPVGTDYFVNNIGAIAIHPTNPDIAYVSELSSRIATTTDGGTTWTTALSISNFNCEDLKIKPDEPEVVLAAGTSLRRRTAGNVWTNVLNSRTYDIAFKPNDPSIVYALVRNAGLDLCEFWKSTDGGQTWTIRSSGWISGVTDGGARMTVTPADNNRIYCVLLTGSGPRVMRSDDAGETWTIIAASNQTGLIGPCTTGPLSMTNGQGFFDLSIVASHSNADHILLGTTTSFKSTDGGVNYTPLGGYCGPFNIHPDIQEMMTLGGDTWIATDGGMNYSTDFFTDPTVGTNYFVRINNLRGTEFWGFDSGWNEDVLVGGRYHNGNSAWRETYPTGDFLRLGGGEAPTGYLNPGNPSLAYFSDIGGNRLPTNNTQAIQSFTVTKWPNETFYPMEGAEQKWDPRYMYTYYLGNGNQFWKTTDNGATFTSLFTHSNANAVIRYVEVSRSNPDVIYFTVFLPSPSTDGELWKTTDGGVNWTQCNNPGTLTANQRRFSKITLSGTDENVIWWCFRSGPNGQKIFKSSDGGSSWSNWTTSTLDNVNPSDILHQLGTDGGVYFVAGNGDKIYYRDNSASDWTPYSMGLPLNLNGDFQGVLAKPYYKGGKLRLASGHGIWEADLFTTSTTTLVQPMVDNPSPSCSRDTLQLESYSVVNGPATYQWTVSPTPQWMSGTNVRNPKVVLGNIPGFYSVTLTVTDNNGTTSRSINNFLNNLSTGNNCAADTIPGKSLVLDGTGDYARPNANLNLNSNTVTLTAWVKRNGTQTNFAGLVYARGGTTSAGLSITSANALRYTWDDAAGTYGFNTNFTIPDNTWTHVALVVTATNATVYMNGRPATRTAAHPAEAFDTPVQIGYDNGSRYFKGEIDEVTVWNRSLTQNEIRELMHLTLDPAEQPNLVSYYQFNETSGTAQDKVNTRHASLLANAARVVSTGPFGGGTSNRQTVSSGGLKTFTGTGVALAFPPSGTYPNGEIVVSRINIQPDSLPACSAYASDNHYWIIENFGTNPTFSALDSARFENFMVPSPDSIAITSYQLNRRTLAPAVASTANGAANAHLLPWGVNPGSAISASGGSSGHISFGNASSITTFGQFLITSGVDTAIIIGPTSVCSGDNVTLTAANGYTSYAWSNGGGSNPSATFNNVTSNTTYTLTVTDANGCTGVGSFVVLITPGTTYYADADNDGFGNPGVSQQACSQPSGYVLDNTDCDDNDALEKPGQVWYADLDNDGYSSGTTLTQCLRPAGYKVAAELTATSGDCNDNNNAINPAATEICDGIDNNCDGTIDGPSVCPDYTITTAGNVITITDVSGNSDVLNILENGSNINFGAPGRSYSLNGGPTTALPVDVPLAGVTSIVVNAAVGDDIISVNTFTINTLPSLTLNGGVGNDQVNFNGDINFAINANLDVDLQNDDANPGVDSVYFANSANLLLSGTGVATLKVSRNVIFDVGSSLETTNGNLTIEANQQATPTAGNFYGVIVYGAIVRVNGIGTLTLNGKGGTSAIGFQKGIAIYNAGKVIGGNSGSVSLNGTGGASAGNFNDGLDIHGTNSLISSNGGNVSVTGLGNGAGSSNTNFGVFVRSGSQISAGGSGTVTVQGTGGATLGDANRGVVVAFSNARITSSGGNVMTTGQGGGTGTSASNWGVYLLGASQITAGGSGTVTVQGTGGASSGNEHYGVFAEGSNCFITSNGGNVSVTGQGGGTGASTSNYGINLISAAQITAGGSGTVSVQGTGGASSGGTNFGVRVNGTNTRITSNGGNVSVRGIEGGGPTSIGIVNTNSAAFTTATSGGNIALIANSMDLASAVSTQTTSTTTLRQNTNNVQIDLGTSTNAIGGPLGLSDAELDLITTGTLIIGNANSGNLTVSSAISCPASTNVQLVSGGDVLISGGGFNTGGGTMLLDPGASPAAVKPTFNGTDVSASTLSFASDLQITINGTTPGDGTGSTYSQLNVAGAVNLTGVDLLFTGTYVPTGSEVFTIVENDGSDAIIGTFTGLAQGATIPNFRGSGLNATISYIGGSGNDVVITVINNVLCYADTDGDGFGDPNNSMTFSGNCGTGFVSNNTDCDDNDALEKPGQIWYADVDNDGYSSGTTLTQCLRPVGYKVASELTATSGDCNDNNNAINPGATEICDGIDNNCNGSTDEGGLTTYYRDQDGDGFGDPGISQQACSVPMGYVANNTDCNDNDALEKPGQIWYADVDNDGYSSGTTLTQCLRPVGYKVPSELIATSGDCNDGNQLIYPGATEVCDGVDNDCNGMIDDGLSFVTYYTDADNDGYGVGTGQQFCSNPGSGFSTQAGDCNDANHLINPGAMEICDGIDNNCNGLGDEGVTTTYYRDQDGDGFGNPGLIQHACSQPTGYVLDNTDCNDSDALEKPGQVWYADVDNDGYSSGSTLTQCLRPMGYKLAAELIANSGDCNDNAAAINPDATEVCDGVDNNCDGVTDEGCTPIEVSIEDPCTCVNNAPVIENGTTTNAGTFSETITIEGPSGQTWTIVNVSGLYSDINASTPYTSGAIIPETGVGTNTYELFGYHRDGVGYTIEVTNGDTILSIGNKCFYPNPVFTGLPAVVAPSAAPFQVTGTVADNVAGTGTFLLDGVPHPVPSPAPTVVTINPATLSPGAHILEYRFDAGAVTAKDSLDPGCVQVVRQSFQVAHCGCFDLTVSLDANCQFNLAALLVADGNCNGGTVRVMDNNPANGGLIDCAGVWTYGLFDAFGNVICWGKVTAEDKRAPELVCAPADVTLDCYDVSYVLNNHLTIGNYGDLSSPRPAANDPTKRTINNAEGVAGVGDNCQLGLAPPALVNDNIKNLGYAYFRDNCQTCGCRITLKWSDRVVYYSCTDTAFVRSGYYAKIERQWVATDCNGMSSSYVQDIYFKRPAISSFVFKNQKKEGKYDQVVTYNSCTPDKSLIKKEDVTPFDCSWFDSDVNPRCLYLDQVECNYSIQIKDTEFPICGGKGVKIDRELYIFDWCAGGIVDTLHILIKIGDFEAPKLEYAHHAPYDISTGPMDCTAAIPVTVAGIKTQFGVTIKDNCALGNVSVKVKTKDRYVKGILVAQNVWDQIDYAVMNGMMIGLPVGTHRLIVDASDACYNAKKDSFEFKVLDKIAPVMKCDDDLHVTLSNANGYTNGYAQVSAADIDEGSWDNCKMAWIAVRRNVPVSCEASFIQKGYDSNGNNKLDAAPFDDPKDAPAGFDWDSVDGVDINGDGDIRDFGEFVATKGGKKMTPMLDYVEFFCCDLTERVTVELWGEDTAGNRNYCWMDLLIEDKVAPTCIAPWDVTIDCDDKNIALIDDKVASSKLWGDVTITTGNDCDALDTVYSVEKSLKCGYGKIVRKWTLSKQTAKGPITITCSQTIWVRPIHQYDIRFPKDAITDCKTPSPDTVIVDELACDLLAVNVSDKRYDATGDECYKIFRTYTVINWCAYDDKCGDPMTEGNVYVVDRATFDNNGKDAIYLLVQDNDRDLNEEFYLSKNLIPNESVDLHMLGDPDRDTAGTPEGNNGYNSTANGKMPYCEDYDLSTDHFQTWEYYHSFMYTQIIKVYDDVRPEVTGIRDTFCTSPTACTANITKVVNLKDNCSDKVTLETQYLMIAPFQTTDAGKMIPYSTPRWSTKDLGNGNYEISVSNLPEGTHDLIVVGRDECGNLSLATRIPFSVKDCKAPAPICINGLSTGIMPDGNGGGMMAVWATDFVASKIYDCNGQGPETKDGLKLITKYSINRVGQPVDKDQTGLNFTCADIPVSPILVELHAWDEAGNHDFCITFVELIDSRGVCPGSVGSVQIAGTIATEGNAKLQGANITLSGSASQSATSTAGGGYSFLNLAKGGDFTVTPQLDKNHLNGVSTFDLVLIQKHILGIQALNSPYKMIAADVNNSKSISTLDLIALRKLILNIDSHFANNTSWRFVDAAYQFPTPSNPWSAVFPEVVSVNDIATNVTANFVAIKIGDVNASASVNGAAAAEIRTSHNFELKTQEQNLKAGNEYKVSFSAEDLQNIQGYQFALNLDQSKVELLDMEYGVAKAENFGVFKNEGLITTSWNAKYEPGTLFTLVLRAKADTKLSQSITLNRLVHPEAYDQNSEYLGIKLNFEGEQFSDSYELKQNTPNPFNAETSIGFTLPKAAKATLSIRDVKGALIYKVEGSYAKGQNQVILKKEQLGASGVLYYTLETSEFTATKKMIILE